MYCTKQVTESITWLGASDRRIALFENIYPVPDGASYNAYLIRGARNILMDTVDRSVCGRFFENLHHALGGEPLHYIVINHMEPDHCSCLGELSQRYPEAVIVGNRRTFAMIEQYFRMDFSQRCLVVEEGSMLDTGSHKLHFVMAPMVHWPEAMVAYEEKEQVLFSADAFGGFGALNGGIFADEAGGRAVLLPEMRRYYTNIVGKYGRQVSELLDKAAGLDIRIICPLHGYIWRQDLGPLLEKYRRWSSYTPEENGVVIFCGSIHGNTQNAADILAARLSELGVRSIALYDVSTVHISYLVAEAFRAGCLVFASASYNGGVFSPMEQLLNELRLHNLSNRTAAFIENGSWAPCAARLMREQCSQLQGMRLLDTAVTIKSTVSEQNLPQLDRLAQEIRSAIM